jgi:small-conductance mechanosensitive channel
MSAFGDLSSSLSDLGSFLESDTWSIWVKAGLWLLIGLPVARLVGYYTERALRKAGRNEIAQLIARFVFIGLAAAAVLSALGTLGVDLSVLLGAAGIFTVAIGFASQTSASNVISGLFLIGERPFSVGDVIQVGTTMGTVESIDLVSIKLRTFNNLYVRIPNESLFKSEIWTLTHYEIRRYDIYFQISYETDFDYLRDIMFEVADQNKMVLDEPQPLFIIDTFLEGSIKLQFSVWGTQANWLPLRATIQEDVKRRLDKEGIAFGMPRSETYIDWRDPNESKHASEDSLEEGTRAEDTESAIYQESNVDEEGKREDKS